MTEHDTKEKIKEMRDKHDYQLSVEDNERQIREEQVE